MLLVVQYVNFEEGHSTDFCNTVLKETVAYQCTRSFVFHKTQNKASD